MTVSVVIASENHATFIAEAMESVLRQTVDIELVVVDSGSTDRTRAVLRSVIAANLGACIELVTQPATGHPAEARNRGVEVAGGELIVCLEPYDMLAPDFVECCRAELDADPGAGFAYTDQ
jgi:glycosyltransferase involved in cell wall biosynthesis